MKRRLVIAAKALFYFLLLGLALPPLIDKRTSALWMLGCAGIAFAITVLPEYLIEKFKRKRADTPAIAVKEKWIRIAVGTLVMFPLMAFAWPAVKGERADAAWVIISAITAPIAVAIADYLTEKQKERKRRNSQEPQRMQSRKN